MTSDKLELSLCAERIGQNVFCIGTWGGLKTKVVNTQTGVPSRLSVRLRNFLGLTVESGDFKLTYSISVSVKLTPTTFLDKLS